MARAAVAEGHEVDLFLAGDGVQLRRDAVLDQLDGLSQTTRQRFLDLSKYESGPWSLAALARVGG